MYDNLSTEVDKLPRQIVDMYICTYIERPSTDAADPNPGHVTAPERLQVPSCGPRRDQSIVQAHSVQTSVVLGEVAEGSWGELCPLKGGTT